MGKELLPLHCADTHPQCSFSLSESFCPRGSTVYPFYFNALSLGLHGSIHHLLCPALVDVPGNASIETSATSRITYCRLDCLVNLCKS